MDSKMIGERLIILFQLFGIKRSYVAKKLGISYNTLSKKLKGEREFGIIHIYKIKELLNMSNELAINVFLNIKFDIKNFYTFQTARDNENLGQ